MERFVGLIVGGGLAMLVGLWATSLLAVGSPAWAGGAALVVAGTATLAAGIWREVEP